MSKHTKHNGEMRTDSNESGADTVRTEDSASNEMAGRPAEVSDPADSTASVEREADIKARFEAASRITALEGEVSSLKDQYLRKLADYENFRKRMFREKEDSVQYANTQILSDLVGVVDDFDRAVRSSETSRDFQALHDGVDMIRKRLLGLLESKYGLAGFSSEGELFDPNLHEAVMSEQGDCEEPVVVEEFVKGYRLRDRIVRSAKVKVRMPAPKSTVPADAEIQRESNAQGE
jgi:molecular chaperone GrpE